MSDAATETEDARKAKEKEARRTKRNLRHAHAHGMMQGILSLLKPGDIVYDLGANVGDVTVPLAQTGATVHAFEPDPFAFEKIKARVDGMDNVVLHNAAVDAKEGEITLYRAQNFDDNPMGGSVKSTIVAGGRNINEDDGIKVQLVNFLALLRKQIDENGEIALVKMDIEGAELELLEAMLEEDLFDHIRLTVVETHERKFRELRPRFRALRKAVGERYPITKVNLDWI